MQECSPGRVPQCERIAQLSIWPQIIVKQFFLEREKQIKRVNTEINRNLWKAASLEIVRPQGEAAYRRISRTLRTATRDLEKSHGDSIRSCVSVRIDYKNKVISRGVR